MDGSERERGPRFLIVDGNSEELRAASISAGFDDAPTVFARALSRWRPASQWRCITPSATAFDPAAVVLDGVDAIVLTGSGVAWSADDRRAAPHQRFLERGFAAGVPVWGSCWGLQIAMVVLGGAVGVGPRGMEIGVARRVSLTAAGRAHPMFTGKADTFDTVAIHRDEVVRLPCGARLLASNAHSEVQAAAYEAGTIRFWGTQYHPELRLDDIADFLEAPGRDGLRAAAGLGGPEQAAQFVSALRGRAASAAIPAFAGARADDVGDADRRERELSNWLNAVAVRASARTG